MIDPDTRSILYFSMRFACFARIIPLEWDNKSKRLRKSTSFPRIFAWYIVNGLILLDVSHLLITLPILIINKEHVGHISLHTVILVAHCIPLLFTNMYFKNRKDQMPNFFNQYTKFASWIQDTYIKKNAPKFNRLTGLLIKCLLLVCITQPLNVQFLFLVRPSASFFISWPFLGYPNLRPWALAFGFVFTYWTNVVVTCLSMTFSPLILSFVASINFLGRETRPFLKFSRYTKNTIRRSADSILIYRCFQLLTIQLNNIARSLLMFGVYALLVFGIVSTANVIRPHLHMDFFTQILFILASTTSTSALFVFYIKFGNVYNISKGFSTAWKKQKQLMGPRDGKLMGKYIRSFRPHRIEIGNTGFFQKSGGLKMIGKMLYYTSKMLMGLK